MVVVIVIVDSCVSVKRKNANGDIRIMERSGGGRRSMCMPSIVADLLLLLPLP